MNNRRPRNVFGQNAPPPGVFGPQVSVRASGNNNLRRAITMSLQPTNSNNLRRAITMSLQPTNSNVRMANNVNSTLLNNTTNNVMMTNRIRNLPGYVLMTSKNSRGTPHYFRGGYEDTLTYIRTSNPELRDVTWSQLIQMKRNTPDRIIAPHPARAGSGLQVGTMRFFGVQPRNVVRNNTPAPGTWVNFNNGRKVRAPTVDETDAFNPAIKLKNVPYFIEVNKNGRKTRFLHTNSKFETSFPERWREVLEAHQNSPNRPFNNKFIPQLRRVVPNIEMYYNTSLGQVKIKDVKLIGKKSEYLKYLNSQPIRNIALAYSKNNIRRMIPKLSENVPEYKLIKTIWKSQDPELMQYAEVILKLVRIEPQATAYIRNNPNLTNNYIQGEITRTITACHLIQTLNQSTNRRKARDNYLSNLRGQLKIAANIFVEQRKTSSNKTNFDSKFIRTFKSQLGGRPCIENVIDALTNSVAEPGLDWKGKNEPALNVNAAGSVLAQSKNRLRNSIIGGFMKNYYNSLNNRVKSAFNKNIYWTGIKNRNVLVKLPNRTDPFYVKLSEIRNGKAISNEAFNMYKNYLN